MVWPVLLALKLVLLAVTAGGAAYADEWRALPEERSEADAARVIAAGLRAIKTCYALAERDGVPPDKATLGLRITAAGTVEEAILDGPNVSPRLESCVRQRAFTWHFSRVKHGPQRALFPVLFLGEPKP